MHLTRPKAFLIVACATAAGIFSGRQLGWLAGLAAALLVLHSHALAWNLQRPPGITGVSFDVQLTSFAHGIAPDYTSALDEIMAPQCVAPAAAGQYVQFDDDEAFRYLDTRRALGGKGARIQISSTSPTFNCDPHSIEIPTDVFEYDKVGSAGIQMLREAKVRTLVSRNALSREKRVFDAYADGTTAENGLGSYTDDDKDPIAEIDSIIASLATSTGQRNIDLVIGLGAFQQIRNHPKVLARMPGADLATLSPERLRALLILPVQIHIAMLPIATEKVGKAASKTVIANDKIYALITQKNPSPFDPSAAKTFTTNLGQVQGVGMYEERPFAEINFMAWSEDIKLTGASCVKRIDVTLGEVVID